MVVYAGQGDARRSLSLLWRAPGAEPVPRTGRSGPKPGLSVDAIVSAGIAVADSEGMAALSMRAVGERLGRTAMALYTYVPGKAELLDLMHDRAFAEMPLESRGSDGSDGSDGRGGSGDWRADVTAWAEALYAGYLRHSWMLQVSQARPVLGPAELAAMEALLRALQPAALPAVRLRGAVGALWQFVRGMAGVAAEARDAAAATGVADADWWTARSARLAELAPDFAERFPLLSALESGGDPDPQARDREGFRSGLAVLLDGIAAPA
ncbi:TetR/AcrR family transcriptional regulator C-terminal domain-containing protein [Streptomyces sp. SP17BM10]|uniref:TetR/AcrR family transcriptional regulator n=1 Tax=Streptomyces sp. SP17BM10 TaxID=3002530 RepID=UPI002E7685BA|nr:TetR/AcrR family transcriptional regulator C-terminal domain-containing protein [Streptomyces sp. SP17BM10]MEE1786095.1 TetR/AcrR family transcriptional regulator C-terminal domain-containing protein [Streptomyces sp. SP17BM10]